jgi:G3E family GTPase
MIDKAERENRQFSNFVDAKKEWHYNSPQHQHHHHERQHEHHQYHKHEQYTLHGNYHNTAVASVSNALKAPGTASNPETLAMTRNREEDKRVLRAKGGFGGLF